ncbi:hypothetical protein HRbin03_00207 [archaeon HR03]|nr:hypothetical protein HRbin03_00207 [archaeon HR03]
MSLNLAKQITNLDDNNGGVSKNSILCVMSLAVVLVAVVSYLLVFILSLNSLIFYPNVDSPLGLYFLLSASILNTFLGFFL